MKNSFLLLISISIIFSCAEKLIEKPDNLIPEDKMVVILKEMAIMNTVKGTHVGKLKDNSIDPATYVFGKFEIDSTQFVDSDRYYASLPLVYESIYKRTEALLVAEKLEYETKKKIADSLNLLKRSLKKDTVLDKTKIKKLPL